jgi:hypothetical protein
MDKRREFLKAVSASAAFGGVLSMSSISRAQTLPQPEIESSFSPPKGNLSGIEPYNDNLWLTFNYKNNNGEHYIVSKEGVTQESFQIQEGSYGVTGLAVHSDRLDFVGYKDESGDRQPRLFKVNRERELQRRLQIQVENNPIDATSVDSYTWVANHHSDGRIQQLDSAGNVRQGIVPRSDSQERVVGLAHDGSNFWLAYQDRIVEADSNGNIGTELAYPRGDSDELGCGYGYCNLSLGHDGELLWIGRTDKGNIIGVDPDVATPTSTPSSTPTSTSQQSNNDNTDPQSNSQQTNEQDGGGGVTIEVPGFGLVAGVSGLAGASYALKQGYLSGDDE